MQAFQSGPFSFEPTDRPITLVDRPAQRWRLNYGPTQLSEKMISDARTADDIRTAFIDEIAAFAQHVRSEHKLETVYLIDFETGESVASFQTLDVSEMAPGLIDDRSRYWLRSADKMYSLDVTLSEFAALAAKHRAPQNSWISGLLSNEVLTDDPENWRAPTNWEIRHVVGEGSFTGVSGAKAAALVGVSPQNFRKYTASDDAKNRQSISFSIWHLLLHKLGIQNIERLA